VQIRLELHILCTTACTLKKPCPARFAMSRPACYLPQGNVDITIYFDVCLSVCLSVCHAPHVQHRRRPMLRSCRSTAMELAANQVTVWNNSSVCSRHSCLVREATAPCDISIKCCWSVLSVSSACGIIHCYGGNNGYVANPSGGWRGLPTERTYVSPTGDTRRDPKYV